MSHQVKFELYKLEKQSHLSKPMRNDHNWIKKQLESMIGENIDEEEDKELVEKERIARMKHILKSKKMRAHWTRSIKVQQSKNLRMKNAINE